MDNKTLITLLSQKLNRNESDVTTLLECMIRAIKDYSSDLDSVAIPGFGTFKTEKSDEYLARNNETGERTLYPPKIEISFQPSIVMRKKLMR